MATWVALNSLAKGQFIDSAGNVQAGRSVNVYLRGTTSFPTGGVAPNSDGSGVLLTQPLVTDSNGDVPGYIQAGQSIDFYDVATTTRKQGEAVSAGGNAIANIPAWAPNTFYPIRFVVVQAGILWQANAAFTSGVSFNAANWTALTAAGTELDRATLTTTFTTPGTGLTVVTGLSVTFVAPARPVRLDLYVYGITQSGSSGAPLLLILDSSNNTVQTAQQGFIAAGATSPSLSPFVVIGGLTAGTSYTYKVGLNTNAGTASIVAVGGTLPAIFEATQV